MCGMYSVKRVFCNKTEGIFVFVSGLALYSVSTKLSLWIGNCSFFFINRFLFLVKFNATTFNKLCCIFYFRWIAYRRERFPFCSLFINGICLLLIALLFNLTGPFISLSIVIPSTSYPPFPKAIL